MPELATFLDRLATLHDHICPRQVLGVRMGMTAADLLHLDLPQSNKRLVTFVETDGCFADGVAVSTGCSLGHRTMRLMDYGKVAATFVDTETERAVRIYPHPDSRSNAQLCLPGVQSRWQAQLEAYQVMPPEHMLSWQAVTLTLDLRQLISHPGVRVNCAVCGEEIINQRELMVDGQTMCRACAGESYYQVSRASYSAAALEEVLRANAR